MKSKECQQCGTEFLGRTNKKFCSNTCKNNHHNEAYRQSNKVVFNLDKKLHKNRAVLKDMFQVYRSSPISIDILKARGFDKNFHTHTFNAPSGDRYVMVYEVGYKMSFDGQVQIIELEAVA
ncbi:MAG: hypothetical protein COA32_08650 [Fluviicola sp.]|nr:MAG: hypothetical protein COA32_08650 [Fluviicola sp.]